MTYEQFLNRILDDGIAEVKECYKEDKDFNHAKREGAIAGFHACRGLSPIQLIALWETSHQLATAAMMNANELDNERNDALPEHWRRRYFELQVEWVCNVVSVAQVQHGRGPLLGWLPTARGAIKYADIVGVAPDPITEAAERAVLAPLIDSAAKERS